MHRAVDNLSVALVLCASLSAPGCGPPAAGCDDPGVICHVAGTGEQGWNGDGLPPEQTSLNLPTAARVGPDGLVYIMDFNNMRLRCLLGEGAVDTIAGNGEHAAATAGAAALDTPLDNPIDFDFAPDGRVLLVAWHDPRVLAVEHDGTVTVVAGTHETGDDGDGGPATLAHFQELAGILAAPDGSIFVSDDHVGRVRVIRPDGTVHTVAGTGVEGYSGDGGPAVTAQLKHPEGLALDAAGNLYIADTSNHRIRRVDAATGIIETVAGVGTGGFSGDGGPATKAELRWPSGVAVAPDGQLYIADTFNSRIRRVGHDGVITTIAGSDEGYSGDGGPAIDALLDGPTYIEAAGEQLYIADTQNHMVRVLQLP